MTQKIGILLCLYFVVSLIFLSCENNKVEPLDDEVFVHHVTITKELSRLKIGEKDTLSASPQNYNGDDLDVEISWISDRPDTVMVDQNGVVTAVADGKAQVYAVAGDVKSPFCNVSCYSIHDILLSYDYRTLIPGDTLQLVAMAKDRQGLDVEDAEFTWQSSNPSIASVDENGLITVHTMGIATITATADGVESFGCKILSVPEIFPLWAGQHNEQVVDVEFHPNGDKVASGGWDNTLRMWDTETGNQLWLAQHDDYVVDIEFSPSGYKIGSACYDRLGRIWDVLDGEMIWQSHLTTGNELLLEKIGFSPEGNHFVTMNATTHLATGQKKVNLKCWDHKQDELVWAELDGSSGHPVSFAYSPDGSRIAYGDDIISGILGKVSIRTASNGFWESYYYHWGQVNDLEFSSDGSRIVSCGGGQILMWSCEDEVYLWAGYHDANDVNALAWSPDGSKIASVSADNTVKVWDNEWGDLLWEGKHNGNVLAVEFSPDGNLIATGGKDHYINIWNAETGELLAIGKHEGNINALSFHPLGNKIFVGDGLHKVKMWEIPSQ